MAVSIDTLRHFFRGAFQNAQWALSVDDFRAYQSQLSMLTYGEMIEESVEQLLGWIELDEQDVFYDLGCGLGRFMAHVYLRTSVRAVYGVEIAESRVRQAKRMLNALKSDPLLYDGRTIELQKGDISEVCCSDATVVYMCSTCYPAELIKQVVSNLQRDAQVGLGYHSEEILYSRSISADQTDRSRNVLSQSPRSICIVLKRTHSSAALYTASEDLSLLPLTKTAGRALTLSLTVLTLRMT